jgi:hypothetical protein
VDEYRRLIAAVGWKPRDPEAIAGPAMYRWRNRSPA